MIKRSVFLFKILASSGVAGPFVAVIALAVLYECLKGIYALLKLQNRKDDSSRFLRRNSEDIDGHNKR